MLKGSIAFSSLLCREVQEETGIAVKTSSRVGVYSNPTVDVAYIAKLQEAVEPHAGQMQRAGRGYSGGYGPQARQARRRAG
jgi:8-oxo-dGTP pyrophosphatase MutT (NUDIX family)